MRPLALLALATGVYLAWRAYEQRNKNPVPASTDRVFAAANQIGYETREEANAAAVQRWGRSAGDAIQNLVGRWISTQWNPQWNPHPITVAEMYAQESAMQAATWLPVTPGSFTTTRDGSVAY